MTFMVPRETEKNWRSSRFSTCGRAAVFVVLVMVPNLRVVSADRPRQVRGGSFFDASGCLKEPGVLPGGENSTPGLEADIWSFVAGDPWAGYRTKRTWRVVKSASPTGSGARSRLRVAHPKSGSRRVVARERLVVAKKFVVRRIWCLFGGGGSDNIATPVR